MRQGVPASGRNSLFLKPRRYCQLKEQRLLTLPLSGPFSLVVATAKPEFPDEDDLLTRRFFPCCGKVIHSRLW